MVLNMRLVYPQRNSIGRCLTALRRVICDIQHTQTLCFLAVVAIATLAYSDAHAVEPGEMLDDPALEARAQNIGAEVRCLVCRNESVEDSNADLARDLRLVIRERLLAGDSNTEVFDYLVDRFGEYVLLRPRFGGSTFWLWLIGPALLIVGSLVATVFVTRRKQEQKALTAQEEAQLHELMKK